MMSYVSTRRLEKELMDRNLLPSHCRLIEVVIGVNAPVIVRYEVFFDGEQLSACADAMKAAAESVLADDERNRVANLSVKDSHGRDKEA